MQRVIRVFFSLVLAGRATLWAEEVYVTDQFSVGVYADQDKNMPVLKRMLSGTGLEVLERGESYTLVRDSEGGEGWIESRYLSTNPPALARLTESANRLQKSQAQLTKLRRKFAETEAALKREATRARVWEKKAVEAAGSTSAKGQLRASQAADTRVGDGLKGKPDERGLGLLWWLVSFAMLLIGFIGGVLWLREKNRRRLGGMHLRI